MCGCVYVVLRRVSPALILSQLEFDFAMVSLGYLIIEV